MTTAPTTPSMKPELIVACCVICLALASSSFAAERAILPAFGDTGLPRDYDRTMRSYEEIINRAEPITMMPAAFDWRSKNVVTPAKNQGSCGSCWAFAATGALESKMAMRGWPLTDLSEQHQVSCNNSMAGCSGGSMWSLRFWEDEGPLTEACTGYTASNTPCSQFNHCDWLLQNTTGYYTVDTSSVLDMQTSLRNDGPTYFRWTVRSDFMTYWNTASQGEVYVNSSGSILGGHAVLLIGWSDSKGAWLCKNSWGGTAGPNGDGTFWIAYSGHAYSQSFGMANIGLVDHPPVVWTGWLDRDNPSGTGDWETRANFPNVCASPVAIDAATLDNVDWSDTGEVLTVSPSVGLVCQNAHQNDNYCLDYKVRFACPGSWSQWLDRDNPSGTGDWETWADFPNICDEPIAILGETLAGEDWTETNETLFCRPSQGLVCKNAQQRDGYCEDYRVRFACP